MEQEFQRKLNKITELLEIEDDPKEPYKSKYEARSLLQQLKKNFLLQKLEGNNQDEKMAFVSYKIGTIDVAVQEPHNAQINLEESLAYLLPQVLKFTADECTEVQEKTVEQLVQNIPEINYESKKCDSNLIDLLNHLGILWCNRMILNKSVVYLKCAQQVYNVLKSEEKIDELAEAFFTHTLFYLAQVYGHLNHKEKSAFFCQQTLERQLQTISSEKVEVINEWIMNCLKLSSCFVATKSRKGMCQTAYCVAACEKLYSSVAQESDNSDIIDLDERYAEIHLHWGDLLVSILKIAYENYEDNDAGYGNDCEIVDEMFKPLSLTAGMSDDDPLSLCLNYIKPTRSFSEARKIFLAGNRSLNIAKKFYAMDGYVTEHVGILQKQSLLFKYLEIFESSSNRSLAMQIRRSDLIYPVLIELNPQAFTARLMELSYESGEVWSDIHELKLICMDEKRTRQSVNSKSTSTGSVKCNTYAQKAIYSFNLFVWLHYSEVLNSKNTKHSKLDLSTILISVTESLNCLPFVIESYSIVAFFRAHFYLARMYGKIIMPSHPQSQVFPLRKSLEMYETVMALADKYLNALKKDTEPNFFERELEICEEMIQLLPLQINKVSKGLVA